MSNEDNNIRNYKVARVDWRKFTPSQYLEMGRVASHAFEFDPMFIHISGPEYSFSTLQFGSIVDPRERLQTITRYERKAREWSRILELQTKTAGCDTFVVYDTKNNNKMAAMCQWVYPDDMVSDLEKIYKRDSYWNKFKLWLLTQWYWVLDRIEYGLFSDTVVFNNRFYIKMGNMEKKYDSKRTDEKTLAKINLDENQVSQYIYPRNKSVYCFIFGVRDGYQGKGIGKKLMNESVAYIPNKEAVFEYNGYKSTGPQQLEMEASDRGVQLYLKCGFECKTGIQKIDGDNIINSSFMVKKRL